jgi:hypothetical protein
MPASGLLAPTDFLRSCHRVACGRRGADVDEPLAFDAADSTTYGRSMSNGSNYLNSDRPEAVRLSVGQRAKFCDGLGYYL